MEITDTKHGAMIPMEKYEFYQNLENDFDKKLNDEISKNYNEVSKNYEIQMSQELYQFLVNDFNLDSIEMIKKYIPTNRFHYIDHEERRKSQESKEWKKAIEINRLQKYNNDTIRDLFRWHSWNTPVLSDFLKDILYDKVKKLINDHNEVLKSNEDIILTEVDKRVKKIENELKKKHAPTFMEWLKYKFKGVEYE